MSFHDNSENLSVKETISFTRLVDGSQKRLSIEHMFACNYENYCKVVSVKRQSAMTQFT